MERHQSRVSQRRLQPQPSADQRQNKLKAIERMMYLQLIVANVEHSALGSSLQLGEHVQRPSLAVAVPAVVQNGHVRHDLRERQGLLSIPQTNA